MDTSGQSDGKVSNIVEIDSIGSAPDSGSVTVTAHEGAPGTSESQSQFRGRWILGAGFIIALLWAAGAIAYIAGMTGGLQGLQTLPAGQLAGLAFGTIGPALFVFVLAWAIREIVKFAKTANRIHEMATRFADPARATRKDAQAMASAVQTQIKSMNTSVEGALARLGAMEEVLNHHSDAFATSEKNARERTDTLINDLRREREAVADLADQLDHKAADIASAIAEQSKMVVSAADIANSQTADGAKILSAATEKLQETANLAGGQAGMISEQLTRSSEQITGTAETLRGARRELETSITALNQTRETATGAFAGQKQEVQELLDVSNQCANRLQSVAEDGAKTMKQTLEEALDQARHYTSIMREEGRALADSHGLKAKELQAAAEEARAALDIYAETISKRLEHANEASFTAASWADKTLEKLQDTTSVLDERLQTLPETADESARAVEEKLRLRLASLNEAAQNASEEAKGIDVAFQTRIRQNYELLSDFMLKMGATAAPVPSEIEVPNPLEARKKPEPESPPRETEPPKTEPALETGLELRRSAEPEEAEIKDGWRWKDVLSRIDRSAQDDQASDKADFSETEPDSVDRLVALFHDLNIEPDQLFDATSYRAAALARITDGHKAMADVAYVDASKAIGQLTDRFARDAKLRLDAELFIAELRKKVDQAANSGQQMYVETHLRTGDGPAYLLLEAALQS
jgi:hypothetical protein